MSDEKLRLFVAVSIPRDQLLAIDQAIAGLKKDLTGARWIDVANQHVTLKFLGWTLGTNLGAIEEAVGAVAARHPSAKLSLGELGAFPTPKRPRVLWIGLEDESSLLTKLAGDLDAALEPLGFTKEERPFTPHLTLARFKLPVRGSGDLPPLDLDLEPFEVDRLELFRSRLHPKGARYEVISSAPLGPRRVHK